MTFHDEHTMCICNSGFFAWKPLLHIHEMEEATRIVQREVTALGSVPSSLLRNFEASFPVYLHLPQLFTRDLCSKLWKVADTNPVPKTRAPVSMEKDILPISLTLVMAKTFELLVLKSINPVIGEG